MSKPDRAEWLLHAGSNWINSKRHRAEGGWYVEIDATDHDTYRVLWIGRDPWWKRLAAWVRGKKEESE